MHRFRQQYRTSARPLHPAGFVLLLEVPEKPWNLILDLKGAWKALEKKNVLLKVLENNVNSLNFFRMGNEHRNVLK